MNIFDFYLNQKYSIMRKKNHLTAFENRNNKRVEQDEWIARGVSEGHEYSTLVAAIAQGTFGISPSEHSNIESLEKENLRDSMTRLGSLFMALGEEAARSNALKNDAQGFAENYEAAKKGGEAAGVAREYFEKLLNGGVCSESYFKQLKKGDSKDGENDDSE